jgi:hypothetical protein
MEGRGEWERGRLGEYNSKYCESTENQGAIGRRGEWATTTHKIVNQRRIDFLMPKN